MSFSPHSPDAGLISYPIPYMSKGRKQGGKERQNVFCCHLGEHLCRTIDCVQCCEEYSVLYGDIVLFWDTMSNLENVSTLGGGHLHCRGYMGKPSVL